MQSLKDSIKSSARKAVEDLVKKGLHISTAESCTSGLIPKYITDVPGASSVFELGIAAYSNRIKTEILKVPDSVLQKHTATSAETATYMALGAARLSGAEIVISTTGVAGPASADGQPMGTVYVGICIGGKCAVKQLAAYTVESREEVRLRAVLLAFEMLLSALETYPQLPEF